MTYEIEVLPAAVRALKKLDERDADRVIKTIDALAEHPRPHGVKKLQGAKDLYRVRVGQYRIIYEVHDQRLLVVVVSLGHRRDVYR